MFRRIAVARRAVIETWAPLGKKVCLKCLELKPYDAYAPSLRHPDGHLQRCRRCVSKADALTRTQKRR